jgi:hypothetical protein
MMHEWWFSHGYGIGPLGALIVAILLLLPVWRICEKAGYPGIVALLVLIPGVNLVFLYWLAFSDWPSLRKRDQVSGA